MLVVSPLVGRLVGTLRRAPPILFGLACMIAGLAVLIVGLRGSPLFVAAGLARRGIRRRAVPDADHDARDDQRCRQRAGMASGIMSAQRAIGSTVGFAVLGSVLAAWLARRSTPTSRAAIPDAAERRDVARRSSRAPIRARTSPRSVPHGQFITPIRPRTAILAVAVTDFVQGIRVALGLAIFLLAAVFVAGSIWFPRGPRGHGGRATGSEAGDEP